MSSRVERSGIEGPDSAYIAESRALDERLLRVIQSWHETGQELSDQEFNDLALSVFDYQLRYNKPYAQYCAARGITPRTPPASWKEIPAIPAAAYKEAAPATFDPKNAALVFHTSGTTQSAAGKHYMETSELYDAGLLATFDRLVLQPFGTSTTPSHSRIKLQKRYGNAPPRTENIHTFQFRYLNLLAEPERSEAATHSSLSYMMQHIVRERADSAEWFVRDGNLDITNFIASVENTKNTESMKMSVEGFAMGDSDALPFFITGTAFAFVEVCDKLQADNRRLHLPEGSVIMETGGFKGRTRTVNREELYGMISQLFNVPKDRIISEYGMTELTSQYYDDVLSLLHETPLPKTSLHEVPFSEILLRERSLPESTRLSNHRVKKGPPWLRTRVIGVDGTVLPKGTIGALAHADLLNRSSCIAIQTEDLGLHADGDLILLGREEGAALRGCSLDAERLRVC